MNKAFLYQDYLPTDPAPTLTGHSRGGFDIQQHTQLLTSRGPPWLSSLSNRVNVQVTHASSRSCRPGRAGLPNRGDLARDRCPLGSHILAWLGGSDGPLLFSGLYRDGAAGVPVYRAPATSRTRPYQCPALFGLYARLWRNRFPSGRHGFRSVSWILPSAAIWACDPGFRFAQGIQNSAGRKVHSVLDQQPYIQDRRFLPAPASGGMHLKVGADKHYFVEYERFLSRPMQAGGRETSFRQPFHRQAELLRKAIVIDQPYTPYQFCW